MLTTLLVRADAIPEACTSGIIIMLRAAAAHWAALLLFRSALATNSTCGVGYEPVGTKCLQLTGSGYTFDECATTECPKRGGHILAGIASVLGGILAAYVLARPLQWLRM